MTDAVVKRYAEAAEKAFPKDPAGFCKRMAEEQRIAWNQASEYLANKKPKQLTGNTCSECGGSLKQAGSCSVCMNCGSTTGCG